MAEAGPSPSVPRDLALGGHFAVTSCATTHLEITFSDTGDLSPAAQQQEY